MLFIIIIYFFFIIWILGGIWKFKSNSNYDKSNNYNVSVIIAVRNEEKKNSQYTNRNYNRNANF